MPSTFILKKEERKKRKTRGKWVGSRGRKWYVTYFCCCSFPRWFVSRQYGVATTDPGLECQLQTRQALQLELSRKQTLSWIWVCNSLYWEVIPVKGKERKKEWWGPTKVISAPQELQIKGCPLEESHLRGRWLSTWLTAISSSVSWAQKQSLTTKLTAGGCWITTLLEVGMVFLKGGPERHISESSTQGKN